MPRREFATWAATPARRADDPGSQAPARNAPRGGAQRRSLPVLEALGNGRTEGKEFRPRGRGAPGYRDYAPGYYAAYLLDPDGNNVEALYRDVGNIGHGASAELR